MRDRLIEFLKGARKKSAEIFAEETKKWLQIGEIPKHKQTIDEIEADYLLENGVIVPPCKVGDTVYCIIKGFSGVMRGRVCSFILTDKKTTIHCAIDGYFGQDFPYCEFGKTVFLNKEEAEAKLKGGEG